MAQELTPQTTNERIAKYGMYVVAAIPVAILFFGYDVRLKYFVLGSGSWAIGVLFKMALYHLAIKRIPVRHSRGNLVAVLNGLSSGICELGAALLAFLYLGKMSVPCILAFGVGIGSFEAWVVGSIPNLLKGTELEGGAEKLENLIKSLAPEPRRIYEAYLPIVERLLASMVHVGTRALVYVSYESGGILPGIGALSCFVLVDGWLAFRLLMSAAPTLRQLRNLYVWLTILAAVALSSGVALVVSQD